MPDPPGTMQIKYLPDPRDEILRRAMDGELTPEQAEAEAERLGLLPLSREPDKAHYDPMREPWWTLAMAAAWIIWRTPDAVREVWPDYTTGFWRWRGPIPW